MDSGLEAQRVVRDELQASKREAKRDVESAARLAELPATSEPLASGEIPQGHARLIARASGESDVDEALLVKAANTEPFDEFARTVKRHQQDRADDDGQALLDRQRKSRKARIFESPESGMFVLSGEFDQITGARIATALTAKERQFWHREDPKARRTPQQRMADALAELICEPAGEGKSQGTDLLVIADYDTIKQQLDNPRLVDGSAIPIVELHRLALEANLLPSIFDTKSQQMWLGRKQRTASEAQRVALIARDQHCIGCGANPLSCRAHHIIWWSKNGPTDLDNFNTPKPVPPQTPQPNQPNQPNVGMRRLPPQNPRPRLASLSTPQNRQIPPQTPQPNQPNQPNAVTETARNPDRSPQRKPYRSNRTDHPSANRTRQPDRTNRIGNPDRTNRTEKHSATRTEQAGPITPAQTGPTQTGPSDADRPNPEQRTEQAGPNKPGRTNRTEQTGPNKRSANRTEQTGPRNAAQPGPSEPSRCPEAQPVAREPNPQRVTAWEGDSIRDQIQGAGNAKASQDRNG